uniref:Photosystem II reaction center protein Z n=2 Tax=Lycoris TaxID=82236 RepID=A0A096ZUC2_9ASPA|nr:photosystem II protein Z [Lycoris caldwellii]AIS25648.1 photosystem II protein Z [Lycoris chinensis x Lycoris sprengeri]
MIIAFQLAVFALIVTSSILLISDALVFASSDPRSSNLSVVFSGTSLSIALNFANAIDISLIS